MHAAHAQWHWRVVLLMRASRYAQDYGAQLHSCTLLARQGWAPHTARCTRGEAQQTKRFGWTHEDSSSISSSYPSYGALPLEHSFLLWFVLPVYPARCKQYAHTKGDTKGG